MQLGFAHVALLIIVFPAATARFWHFLFYCCSFRFDGLKFAVAHQHFYISCAAKAMSIPGAGLLSLIRGRSETVSPATSTIATAEDKRFAARSDAVRALEHAVAAGSSQPQSKPIARGRCIPPLEAYAFDLDAPLPEERQINLEVHFTATTFTDWNRTFCLVLLWILMQP